MRTVTYGAACSLDGFISARDGALDWLHMSADVRAVMSEYWATIDATVWGRKTWDLSLTLGGRSSPGRSEPDTYVCSRTLASIPTAGVHLVSTDAGAFVRELKAQPGKGICVMSGGDLATSLLAAGVVDEVRLNVHPILLGAGVPLFRDAGRRIQLELTESRTIAGGCTLVSYRVRPVVAVATKMS
jgi:dihydrofolate reductase